MALKKIEQSVKALQIADLSGRMIGSLIRLRSTMGDKREMEVEVRQIGLDANDAGLHVIIRRADAEGIDADIGFIDVEGSGPEDDRVFAYIGEYDLDHPIELIER